MTPSDAKILTSVFRKNMILCVASRPDQRGATRRHGRRRRDAMDESASTTDASDAVGEAVVLIPRRWNQVSLKIPASDGGYQAGTPGERAISRKNHCAGNAGMSRLTCHCLRVLSAFYLSHTRLAGASQHPAFPAPFSCEGVMFSKPRAHFLSRECEFMVSAVMCCLTCEFRKHFGSASQRRQCATERFCGGGVSPTKLLPRNEVCDEEAFLALTLWRPACRCAG